MTYWSTYWTNSALVIISTVLILVSINEYFYLFPVLGKCLTQWKSHREIEHNMPYARTRNFLVAIFSVPFCLIIDRYSLYHPDFFDAVPPLWGVFAAAAAYIFYRLVRVASFAYVHPKKLNPEERRAIHRIFDNILIILVSLMMVSVGILMICRASDFVSKIVLYAEMGVAFVTICTLICQFLAVQHSRFSTFLYLCALEIIPLAAMVAIVIFL